MLQIITPILNLLAPALAKFDPNERARLEADITRALIEGDRAQLDTIKSVVLAETQAGGLNALWRPLLALFYLALMAWAWILVPVVNAAFAVQIWTPDASTIATVGGIFTSVYGLGRSLEKGVSAHAGR